MIALSWRAGLRLATLLLLAPLSTACASAGKLGEYSFPGRTLAVVTTAPPHASVSVDEDWTDAGETSLTQAFMAMGSRIVRDVSAWKTGERLDSAARTLDLAGRMADRLEEGAHRILRTVPGSASASPDFELELRIEEYGIEAEEWSSEPWFRVEAQVILREAATGRTVWKTDVDERQAFGTVVVDAGSSATALNNVATAAALGALSVDEIQRRLESVADEAAWEMVEKLRKGMDKARGDR